MKTRKLVLIVADVVLLAVCLVQFIRSARDTTKYFTFKDEPDSLEIVTPQETISLYKEGEEISAQAVRVSDVDGIATLSVKKIRRADNWNKIKEGLETKEIFTGKVTKVVKGGVIVTSNFTRVFIPAGKTGVSKEEADKIKKQMDKMITEMDQTKRYEMYANDNPELAEKLKIYKELIGE